MGHEGVMETCDLFEYLDIVLEFALGICAYCVFKCRAQGVLGVQTAASMTWTTSLWKVDAGF